MCQKCGEVPWLTPPTQAFGTHVKNLSTKGVRKGQIRVINAKKNCKLSGVKLEDGSYYMVILLAGVPCW